MNPDQKMASESNNFTRRASFGGLLLPAALLMLGGCGRTLQRVTSAEPQIPEGRGGFAMRPDGTRVFRDHKLVDQDGRTVYFQRDLIEGKVFGATFQYAQCNGICADMTNQMKKAYMLMKPIMGNPVQFYMFSLAEDSPAVMKEYMQARGIYGLPGWRFLSGSREAITDIRWAFGFGEPNEELDQNLSGHTGMVRLGNHQLDKWAACPAQGSPEATARLFVRLFPADARPVLPGTESKIAIKPGKIPNWTPARPLGVTSVASRL
jgi:protein SCO1/2